MHGFAYWRFINKCGFFFFFSAWVPVETVYPYIGNKEKFLLTTRIPRGFKEAIEAIEDAIKALPEEVCCLVTRKELCVQYPVSRDIVNFTFSNPWKTCRRISCLLIGQL